ncbi:hypothetical protein MCAG_03948 [Micromonospora sp. ATCC 39149]|nr:hypothetical protein MCAG_03948 [Micromonospora sp. ATCC 39149]
MPPTHPDTALCGWRAIHRKRIEQRKEERMDANATTVGVDGLTGLDIDTFEIGDYLDETVLDTADLTETMTSSSSCTTCICTCSCSS